MNDQMGFGFDHDDEDIPIEDEPIYFDGETYDPERDRERLNAQLRRVYDCMCDGVWRTLQEISKITGDLLQSISARLRDLRKPRFGGHIVERRNVDGGLFEYRLILRQSNGYEYSHRPKPAGSASASGRVTSRTGSGH